MTTIVGLVGNGAREHIIAEKLVEGGANLVAYMSALNPGIEELCGGKVKIGNLEDFESISNFMKSQNVEFVVIGPEAPLVVGIVDALKSQGIKAVGPTIQAAQLEGSKMFTRNLLKKYKIESNILFQTFEQAKGVMDFCKTLNYQVVIKPDGLTGGKGVKVFGEHLHSETDIEQYILEILRSGGLIVVEEKCDGEEFTYICFVDGKNVVGTPLVQDHKRAFVGDKGPNTGGMGSYTMQDHLMPFVTASDVEDAHKTILETIKALKEETSEEFKGFLYGQFMKTKTGVKLIEYNVRFGDPEAINVLGILETNFVDICRSILEGTLDKMKIAFTKKATVCKYLVPDGYPTNPLKHEPIKLDPQAFKQAGIKYYFASVSKEGGVIYTSSSRAVAILGVADSIQEAEKLAEKGCGMVEGALYHRSDIGTMELIQKRIDHMKAIGTIK
jgi:phosphoribosylamine--glycine ligase